MINRREKKKIVKSHTGGWWLHVVVRIGKKRFDRSRVRTVSQRARENDTDLIRFFLYFFVDLSLIKKIKKFPQARAKYVKKKIEKKKYCALLVVLLLVVVVTRSTINIGNVFYLRVLFLGTHTLCRRHSAAYPRGFSKSKLFHRARPKLTTLSRYFVLSNHKNWLETINNLSRTFYNKTTNRTYTFFFSFICTSAKNFTARACVYSTIKVGTFIYNSTMFFFFLS